MRLIKAVLVLPVLMIPSPSFGMTICSSSYDSSAKWAYRIIEGRKCWYRLNPKENVGEREKGQLHWPMDRDAPFPPVEQEVPPAKTNTVIPSPDEGPGEFEVRWDQMQRDLQLDRR